MGVTDGTQEEPPTHPLTATMVGKILGKSRRRVHEIPEDQLPYTATRGGTSRAGRRYYQASAVEAYLNRRDRMAAIEADVADLKQWREQHEHNHPQR